METTEPPPSDWSNPSQFLAEIKGLRDYLGIFISNESKGLRDYLRVFISKIFISNVFSSKNIILTDIICFCFKEVQKIIDICDLPNAMSSPLFGVFICEFENLTKKVIDDLKSKTENYAKEIDFKSLHDILTNLSNSLKKNIYLIYETECIKSNEGSISSNSLVSTKSYIKIGEVLKNSSKAIQIKQKLAELRSNGDGETSYYASIVGPSFLGKTQTAFTLSHHMTVFYVNLLSTLNTEDVTMQPIYKETSVFSRLFFETIEADMETVEKKGCDINAHDLLHFKLGFETLGLLYALIHDEKLNLNLTVEEKFMRWCSLGLVVVPKLTVPDFKKKLQGKYYFNIFLVINF